MQPELALTASSPTSASLHPSASLSNGDIIAKIVASLNVKLHPRELKSKDHRTLLQLIMSQWLPLATTAFQTVVEIIPPPQIAQSIRVPKMLHPDAYVNSSATVQPNSKLEKDLYSCDPTPDAGLVVYVSKMFAVKKSELPENRAVVVTADDMRERGRIERQRRAAELERERQLDKMSLLGLGADGKVESSDLNSLANAGVPIPAAEVVEATFISNGQPAPRVVPAATPDLSDESSESGSDEALIGFSRLYSGTLTTGTTLHCLLPKYDTALPPSHPRNAKFITQVTVSHLYMMMGRDLVKVDTVPAGNVFAIGGLEGKVWRNATLCALSGRGVQAGESDEDLAKGLVNLAGVIMTVRGSLL